MGLGLVEISGRESSLISARSFSRHVHEARRSSPVHIDYVAVSESRLTAMALSGPGGILAVTAGSKLHVCRSDRSGSFRAESWQYRNDCQLVACEWFAVDASVAILADVSGHLRVLDVFSSATVSNMYFGDDASCAHLAMSPLDHTLFIACLNAKEGCRLVDIRNGSHSQIIGVNPLGDAPSRAATCSAWSMSEPFQCVVGRANQVITVFDIRRPKPLFEIPSIGQDASEPITDLRFSPSGSNIFAASMSGRLVGWRVDGDLGLCKPTRSHAFSAYIINRAQRIRFAVSSDSVYFPKGASVTMFATSGGPGARPTELPIGLGEISAALWDECEHVLYTCDDNGVVGVVTSEVIDGRLARDDDQFIEWESYSDDSDVDFPHDHLVSNRDEQM